MKEKKKKKTSQRLEYKSGEKEREMLNVNVKFVLRGRYTACITSLCGELEYSFANTTRRSLKVAFGEDNSERADRFMFVEPFYNDVWASVCMEWRSRGSSFSK